MDKLGGTVDKHGGISDKLADTQNQPNPRFQPNIEENIESPLKNEPAGG